MHLERIDVTPSPADPGRIRIEGTVRYDRGSPDCERYWFDVPQSSARASAPGGDPWLAALLPLAVTLREPLHINAPVDARLLDNVRHVMSIWRAWYPRHVDPVTVTAEPSPRAASRAGTTAAFFSGGIDSLFTVLRPRGPTDPVPRDLVTVWGFDLPVDRADAIVRLQARYRAWARSLGKGYVDVITNIRCTRWARADWGRLAHGSALAAAALVIEPGFGKVLIAATGGYRDLHPWGSHPLTDPLLSTDYTSFAHDGAEATRVEKARLLAGSREALELLRVCWVSERDKNCGVCSKCLRAMTVLELLGALADCPAFPERRVAPERLARIYCAESWDFRELWDIEQLAREIGRRDLARAARSAMWRSRWISPRVAAARALRRHGPGREFGAWWERRLLRGWSV